MVLFLITLAKLKFLATPIVAASHGSTPIIATLLVPFVVRVGSCLMSLIRQGNIDFPDSTRLFMFQITQIATQCNNQYDDEDHNNNEGVNNNDGNESSRRRRRSRRSSRVERGVRLVSMSVRRARSTQNNLKNRGSTLFPAIVPVQRTSFMAEARSPSHSLPDEFFPLEHLEDMDTIEEHRVEHQTLEKFKSGVQTSKEWLPTCDEELRPKEGLEFDNLDECENFYKTYAHHVGFSV